MFLIQSSCRYIQKVLPNHKNSIYEFLKRCPQMYINFFKKSVAKLPPTEGRTFQAEEMAGAKALMSECAWCG